MANRRALEGFREEVLEALKLLERGTAWREGGGRLDIARPTSLPSLLEQCRNRLNAQDTESRPAIRTVHNVACSGGTLLSRCISAMPNVELLSEVEPLSTLGKPGLFTPTDMIALVRHGSRPDDEAQLVDLFLTSLEKLYQSFRMKGVNLVLRDHAHSIFFDGDQRQRRPHLRAIIEDVHPLRSLVLIRHPLSSFVSLERNRWVHFSPPTLDAYAQRFLAFLDAHRDLDQVRYEQFVTCPEAEMRRVCEILELRFNPDFMDTFSAFTLSGDSGRSGNTIEPRPPRPISDELATETENSKSYRALCRRLGYPSVPDETEIDTQKAGRSALLWNMI